nr:hypothetical protein [Hassalia byssoidea]
MTFEIGVTRGSAWWAFGTFDNARILTSGLPSSHFAHTKSAIA